MLVVGVGDTGGAGASAAGQGEVGVRVTGWGWVGDEGARPEVGAKGAGLEGGDNVSLGSEVCEVGGAEDGGDLDRLAVKAGWRVCRFVSTLIATIEYKV